MFHTYFLEDIDAVGKPRSGLLRFNNIWLGSYAECRDISNAHYCTAQIKISFPKTTISAVCSKLNLF